MADWIMLALRLGLYLSLGLLAGIPLFRCLAMRDRSPVSRVLVIVLAIVGAIFSVMWLLASAVIMGGTPITQPDWLAVDIIVNQTPMGLALKVRLVALALMVFLPTRPALLLLPASIAIATLAWTGHAAASEGSLGIIHLASDIVHMLFAATWLGALASFITGVFGPMRDATQAEHLARFALPGTVIVAGLIVTGIYNLVMIVGFAQISWLVYSTYGALLTLKLLAFAGMLGLAAANRWLLTPYLVAGSGSRIGWLRVTLVVEAALWVGIAIAVARLGMLDPVA